VYVCCIPGTFGPDTLAITASSSPGGLSSPALPRPLVVHVCKKGEGEGEGEREREREREREKGRKARSRTADTGETADIAKYREREREKKPDSRHKHGSRNRRNSQSKLGRVRSKQEGGTQAKQLTQPNAEREREKKAGQ
jgi:hypothetical protein